MADLSLFDLSGQKAVVTGGTRGIGHVCALALARAGADVAVAGRDERAGESAVAALRKICRNTVFVRCDVTHSAQVTLMVAEVVRHFGRLDIAINNVGRFVPGDDETQSTEDWESVVRTNMTGTWLCAQAEMRQMRTQIPTEGKIINIASIAAHIACSNGAYDASKAAIVHLTRTLAARWGRYNINVNSISPGYVDNPLRSDKERQRLADSTPLGCVERPDDLVGAIVFFASKASNYVTGQDLVVDGGHTLSTWMVPLARTIPPRVD